MTARKVPEWFGVSEALTPMTMPRLAEALERTSLTVHLKSLPTAAFWFLCNSLYIANIANRDGMHANALAITRQCLEAISIMELGLSGRAGSQEMLEKWDQKDESPGSIRKWLEKNVWLRYGSGIWTEPWSDFMRKLYSAIQPYAHYSASLAQWQTKIHHVEDRLDASDKIMMVLQTGPKVYDPQKATRITLYHALIGFVLAKIWLATGAHDDEFSLMVEKVRIALGNSAYLDGSQTDWDQQFWAMMWFKDGSFCPE